jgi:hypothetical protein
VLLYSTWWVLLMAVNTLLSSCSSSIGDFSLHNTRSCHSGSWGHVYVLHAAVPQRQHGQAHAEGRSVQLIDDILNVPHPDVFVSKVGVLFQSRTLNSRGMNVQSSGRTG